MAKSATPTPSEPIITAPSEPITAAEPIQERDKFALQKFIDPDARLPFIQALRGPTKDLCGYFVPVAQMAAAGWKNLDEANIVTYTYESSGNEEQGILIPSPRMLVCPKTPVLGFDRQESQTTKSTVVLGRYTSDMKGVEHISNLQYFQIFLLDGNNQRLHEIPLSYKATGANQATFSIHWQSFCQELNICHSLVNRIPAKPKNNQFNSLCVFCFSTSRDQVGDKQKSFAIRVVDHEKPTTENWRSYFVGLGLNDTEEEYVWSSLSPEQPLMIPGAPQVPQLLAAPTDDDPPY